MSITVETRRAAHEYIGVKAVSRRELILNILGDRQMTVDEIENELIKRGVISMYNRNYVAPRLTELKKDGIVETIGKCKSERTGLKIAVWRKCARTAHTACSEAAENTVSAQSDAEGVLRAEQHTGEVSVVRRNRAKKDRASAGTDNADIGNNSSQIYTDTEEKSNER